MDSPWKHRLIMRLAILMCLVFSACTVRVHVEDKRLTREEVAEALGQRDGVLQMLAKKVEALEKAKDAD